MPEPVRLSPVTDNHFLAFGAIIHLFARHEFLMIGIVSALTGATIFHTAMLMAELPYRGKRDTVLALIKLLLSHTQVEQIKGYLGQLHTWNALRNSIAHSTWVEGARPDSIKAFGMSVRGGEADPKGVGEDERDYTAKELNDISDQLKRLHTRFRKYLDSQNLLGVRESKADKSASTSSSPGTPSAK